MPGDLLHPKQPAKLAIRFVAQSAQCAYLAHNEPLPASIIINCHVEPHAEHVLVVLRIDARQHQCAVCRVVWVLPLAD
jgi:hypothetical protein